MAPTAAAVCAPPVGAPRLGATAAPLPGLAAAGAVAAGALGLHAVPELAGFSPAILAIALGMAARRMVGLPGALAPGLAVAVRGPARAAVVLLGLQVTVADVAGLGVGVVAALVAGLVGCFAATVALGRWLGVERRLAQLIAAGTAVCGASAVAAANGVTRGSDEDVAYAMTAVTLLGTVAMVATPLVAGRCGLDPATTGLWLGASLQEVAQVVGAAAPLGDTVGTTAMVAKMTRVLMLAPLVLTLAALARRHGHTTPAARVPVPWFAAGFVALAAAASLGLVPPPLARLSAVPTTWLLATALAALGWSVDLRALGRRGWRPLALAGASWLMIAAVSLALLRTAV